MWFNNLVKVENPGTNELKVFVRDLQQFLLSVIEDRKFRFLWRLQPELRELAVDTYRYDVAEVGVQQLLAAIPDISELQIKQHGLEGRPLRFKFQVINAIANQLQVAKKHFAVRSWFKKLIDAIDALLDSIIDAAGGAGALIKEFKDAIGSLA